MMITLGAVSGKFSEYIPHLFFLTAANGQMKLNINRIVEAVIIALLVSAVVGWKVKPELLHIKEKITHLETQVDKIYSDIYHPAISPTP